MLSDGLARAYDQTPEAATYLFLRGDDRSPDKEHPLPPNVPAALGVQGLKITPVSLPAESYTPQINGEALARATRTGQSAVASAKQKRDKILEDIRRLEEQIEVIENSDIAFNAKPFIDDEFETIDSQRWKTVSGDWSVKDGKLIESRVTSFATIVTTENHPRNFVAKARYRKLQPGRFRSVGFSFDYVNGGRDSQDVYTARADGRPHGSVQAFHRQGGKQTYPAAGIKPADIKVGQWVDLEFKVREMQLTIKLNGEVKLEYALPLERIAGKFAIWVHTGSAEFERLSVTPLIPSIQDLQAAIIAARHQLQVAELSIELARAELDFQLHQIKAERLRLNVDSGDVKTTALAAGQAERRVELVKASVAAKKAERQLALSDNDQNRQARNAAIAKVAKMEKQLAQADGKYTPLKSEFPATSTGRRLALARWLTRPEHPRTSRVAVNHSWMRHFGKPLVASVDNFGLSGKQPTHPKLLDWLAGELVQNGWSMKHLHKLIVMSAAYRLSSRPGPNSTENRRIDPNNDFLWRANSRRMEAEVVRDSMLAVSGKMDLTTGGPDIDEKQGQTLHRRSLYFRTTPDNQMQMMALFDQANPDECYRRRESVVPQQALALMNGRLAIDLSRMLAGQLSKQLYEAANDCSGNFVEAAFETILSRKPTEQEIADCVDFLKQSAKLLNDNDRLVAFPPASAQATVAASSDPQQRARENLVLVLFNHNEFVTIR